MSDIKKKILNDLDFGSPVTYSIYGLNKDNFKQILYELQDEGLIWFNLIDDKSSPFYGDTKYIKITDKGREFIRKQ